MLFADVKKKWGLFFLIIDINPAGTAFPLAEWQLPLDLKGDI
ncbi:hypothetical protein DCCM_0065 [Desulfocucumis palustris]|uniref:Uncharacterized protein n=1 Tax=Desulfocucumis palustris TaxID=1898651 RepID=A0A2L2XDI0_9FIRM|nr:hypothetical protein DCCM_0065 [Desulfocucumis palustris]